MIEIMLTIAIILLAVLLVLRTLQVRHLKQENKPLNAQLSKSYGWNIYEFYPSNKNGHTEITSLLNKLNIAVNQKKNYHEQHKKTIPEKSNRALLIKNHVHRKLSRLVKVFKSNKG